MVRKGREGSGIVGAWVGRWSRAVDWSATGREVHEDAPHEGLKCLFVLLVHFASSFILLVDFACSPRSPTPGGLTSRSGKKGAQATLKRKTQIQLQVGRGGVGPC